MVSRGVPESKGYDCFLSSDNPFREGLCCPCKGNAGRHHVEPHLLGNIDKLQDLEAVHDPKHGTDGEDQLKIIRDLAIEITVLLLEPFPHEADMDAAHGASCAGSVSEERDLGEPLTADARDRRICSCLQVPDRQGLDIVQPRNIAGGAEVMVFAHHAGVGHVRIDFFKDFRIFFTLREREGTVTVDHDGFQIFGSHNTPAAESPEVAIGVSGDAGHGRLPFPCRTDPKDRPVPCAGEHASQDLSRNLQVGTPKIVDVFHLYVPGSDNEGRRRFRPACNHQSIKVGKTQGQG